MFGDTNLRRNNSNRTMASMTCLVFLLISTFTVNFAYGVENSMEILQKTLPAYAVTFDVETTLNSSVCARELRIFKDAIEIRKLWALKMLDSSGEPKPGFIYGNNYWLGSRSQCIDTTNESPFLLKQDFVRNWTRFRKIEDEFPPFNLNYFVAHFRHNSTLQYHVRFRNEDLVTLGLCLPAACTTDEISSMLRRVFQERIFMVGRLYAADFELVNVRDLQNDHKWLLNGRFMVVGVVFLLTICAMIVGTAYDVLVYQKYLKVKKELHHANLQNNNAPNGSKSTVCNAESLVPVVIKHPGILGEIVRCFSIYTNTKIVFDTKLGSDAVPSIHGLRFLGMIWIIMIHTIFYMADVLDNKSLAWRMSDGFVAQVFGNATLSVDTFFFLSGFLVAYLYYKPSLKNTKEPDNVNYKSKAIEFFGAVLKRFVSISASLNAIRAFRDQHKWLGRFQKVVLQPMGGHRLVIAPYLYAWLTPAYMMMIGIVEINAAYYSRTSQFYMSYERPQETCATYWWRNLLYINNFFGRDTMCLSWSWYLSNDMQFFVIGTFLVILSSIYFYAAVTILAFLLFGSTLLAGYVAYIHGYVPTMDEQQLMLDIFYDPPWMRIGPYIVGIVAAYILVNLKNKLTLRRRNVVILWILGSGCNLVVLFGLYKRYISVLSSAFYMALSRTVWGVGIAWLVIACSTNHGGIVNSILTFKGWVPLSRLTYCAYLINPFLITSIYLNSESSMHIDSLPGITIILGNLVTTYVCSYVYSLMMETPYILIMRLLTVPRPRNN